MFQWLKKKTVTSTPSLLNVGFIFLVVFVIAIVSYKPGTILTGWDNLHPEFNFFLNIKRSLFAVWQEYQSLGLLGGMGHAADLVRQIFLLMLSSFIPQQALRYVWTFLTLFIGGSGMVFLSTSIVSHTSFGTKARNVTVIPLLASLFYVFNLATLQTYYVPFETFTAHFAFLPWMLLTSIHFFNNQSKKNALILALTLFITTPQSYVPTLFVVFLLGATIILLSSAYKLVRLGRTINLLKIAIKYYSIVLLSNAFWLLPFLHFTFTNASTNVNAKINQLATPRIILQNKEFGTLQDVMLLKGFWFNSIDPNLAKVSTYMLEPWRDHLANPLITLIGFIMFGIVLFGVIEALRRKEPLLVSFGVLFLFVFTMLANNTPPFMWIDSLFSHIPLFSQAFRFPFTKFSLLAGLLYGLFFGIGMGRTIELANKLLPKLLKRAGGIATSLLVAAGIVGIFAFSLPTFQGKFIYEKEQLKMPNDYQKVFNFFDKKDGDARIATLPMAGFWSWNYYEWGYGGSGFLWYGLKQPVVDRAFDSWGATSENSYNELSYALYSKNPEQFENVLNKYNISYLIVDRNIYSVTSQKSLFYSETEGLLSSIKATKEASFGKIDIYRVQLKEKTQNFVYSRSLPQSVNGYTWGDNDIAYKNLGDYITSDNSTTYYPLRSLFSNKILKQDFAVEQTESEISLVTRLPKITESRLVLPSYANEQIIPVEITVEPDNANNSALISVLPLFPKVQIGKNVLTQNTSYPLPLFVVPKLDTPYSLFINGEKMVSVDVANPQKIRTYLKLTQENIFSLSHAQMDELSVQTIQKETLISLPQMQQQSLVLKNIAAGEELTITIPKAFDSLYSYKYGGKDFNNASDCNTFRNGKTSFTISGSSITYNAANDSLCSSVYSQGLLHDEGYLLTVNAKNEKGTALHFWALNDYEGIAPIDLNLSKNGNSTFFLPPMEKNAISYSFHADTVAIGTEVSKNTLNSVEAMHVPYNYLVNIVLTKPFISSSSFARFTTTHPNESLYVSTPKEVKSAKTLLVLSQSYDKGWQAYAGRKTFWSSIFPFFLGKRLEHVKVNNWENGWITDGSSLPKGTQITIVYLPQYLQYFGFLSLSLFLAVLLLKPIFAVLKRRLGVANAFFEKRAQFFKELVSSRLNKSSL